MAEKGSSVWDDWPKWKVALCVGAPVAVGIAGLWYYKKRQSVDRPGKSDGADSTERGKSESGKHDHQDSAAHEQVKLTPLEQAQNAKNKGNKYFKGGKFVQAIDCYTEAINGCPPDNDTDMATFYQNRAAAHEQLKEYAECMADCTKALHHNNKYTKALFRRARAAEQTGQLMQCLEDVTAVCILESFQNQASLLMADRVLKELGKSKAKATYANRTPVLPSGQFIRTYFASFKNDPIMNSLSEEDTEKEKDDTELGEDGMEEAPETIDMENKEGLLNGQDVADIDNQGPGPFLRAKQCLRNKDYRNIVEQCTEEIARPDSRYFPEALLLRATFYLLQGEGHKAIQDFDSLLKVNDISKRVCSNALIKRGSLKMQIGDQTQALDDFATAVREDPENSDIYHHRGQLNLLIDRVDDAVKDFEKSVSLSPGFATAHAQKCYTEYRLAFVQRSPMQLQSAMSAFEDCLKRFPDCAEGFALYGQALCDQQQYSKADENFKRALEIEPDNGNVNVHRGLLQLQWKSNIEEAARFMNKALEVDSRCEFAYETLGTIEVQRGNLDKAIELFNKAINLAKTEMEMAHLYSLLDAAIAQSRVAKNFDIQMPLGVAS